VVGRQETQERISRTNSQRSYRSPTPEAERTLGELRANGKELPKSQEGTATPIQDAITMFTDHVRTHSPDKPETHRRYAKVLEHFERHLGKRKFIEAITRADIDDFKIKRTGEKSQQHDRKIAPRTINFEVSVLRTFFYFLVNERGLNMENLAPASSRSKTNPQKPGRNLRPTPQTNSTESSMPATKARRPSSQRSSSPAPGSKSSIS